MTRWRHRMADRHETSLQFYCDRTHRDELLFDEMRDTVDFEFQYRFPIGTRHDVMWGVGTRVTIDVLDDISSSSLVFTPRQRTDHLVSGFIQDQITLIHDRLTLTLGSKFEHNSFSGFEAQPNARLIYSPNAWNRVWTAISRAVRTPARFEAAAFFVDRLPKLVPSVPSYVRLDIRLGWRPTEAFDLSLVGQNLLDNRHPEWGSIFGVPVRPLEVQRSVYVQAWVLRLRSNSSSCTEDRFGRHRREKAEAAPFTSGYRSPPKPLGKEQVTWHKERPSW